MATAGTDSNAATDPECFRGGVVRLVLLPLPSKIVLSGFFSSGIFGTRFQLEPRGEGSWCGGKILTRQQRPAKTTTELTRVFSFADSSAKIFLPPNGPHSGNLLQFFPPLVSNQSFNPSQRRGRFQAQVFPLQSNFHRKIGIFSRGQKYENYTAP